MPVERPDLSRNTLTYLGNIVGNAWQDFRGQGRGSATRALWQAINSAAQRTGLPKPSFAEVNRARAWAAEQGRAARQFARAASSETDWSRMMATVSRSRPLEQRDAAPRRAVYWQSSHLEDDQPVIDWHMHSIGRNLPSSVGDLREQLQEAAAMGLGTTPPVPGEFTGVAFIADM